MNRRLATMTVAFLLVPAVAGCSFVSSGSAGASPTGSALPTLSPGVHTTVSFQPTTTYTVPAGWANQTDVADYFNLVPATDPNNGVHVFHNPQPLAQDASCPATPQPGVSATAQGLVAWIRSLKGLNVSAPAMVTVAGLPATQIDVSILTSWTQTCPFANGLPTVPLFYRPSVGLGWWLAGDEKLRLYLVDVPNQGTVIVDLDSFDGTGFGSLLTNGQPIVKSLTFAIK